MSLEKIIAYSVSLFYGFIVILISLYDILRLGRKFFQVKHRDTPPEELLDPELGTHHYVTLSSGIKIHYVSNGDNNKPMMLFLHGFPEFWYSWRHQLKEFKSDFWVVAPDLRGYGDSDKPKKVEDYTVLLLVQDVKELIEALGKEKVILVCHDWGGVVGWSFASKHSNMVEKLIVLNAPHPTHFREVLKKSWKQFFMSWYIFLFQLPILPEIRMLANDIQIFDKVFKEKGGSNYATKQDIEAYKYTFSKPGAITPPLNYYRAFNKLKRDSDNRITVPTIVIWGKDDFALSLELATGCSKYIDNFTSRIIEDASHFVQSHKPDIVNGHIKDFIKT